ncbi:hypothetical protein ACFQL7_22915 [Halocatena marina]|uniref:Lrp/AsnC family transcriptional regulator n=1 Tax=Halocatena marina TaxID=2934937 RepID=A0ABD5YTY6_9EURY
MSWEIVRIAVKATNADSMKDEAFDRISEMPFWHVTRGIGTYDVYAVGMAPSMRKIDEFVTTIREFDCVENIEHIVVTERRSNLDDYYRTDTEEE